MDENLTTTTLETPIGTLTVIASAAGVRAVLWPGESYDGPAGSRVRRPALAAEAAAPGAASEIARRAVEQLCEYFEGVRLGFDLPLDPQGTAFQLAAWSVLRTIPFGRTMTYGEQARALGDRNKARAVGAANGRNPLSIVVPCHRVVGSDGSLTGFAGGLEAKTWLLRHERRVLGVSDLGL